MDQHLHSVSNGETKLRTEVLPSDVREVIVGEEEQQEWSSSLDQEDPEPPHIKEEQEDLWTSQEGEQLQGPGEADITKFPFTPVPVKSEDDEEKPQSSQLHQSPTEENREAGPLTSSSTKHMETEADGDECGGSEPGRKTDPLLQPNTEDKRPDWSEPETDDSEDWIKPESPEDVYQLLESQEEVPPEQQEWSSSLDQEDPQPPHIKEEQEELWTSQEGEQLQGLEEADITKFPFIPVLVKSEDDEEKPQSSQLHQSPTEENREAEPLTSSSTENKKTRGPLKSVDVSKADTSCDTDKKQFICSECGKKFGFKKNLKRHIRIHTGEKPFSCSICGTSFIQKDNLTRHMVTHTGEKLFSCSVCDKRYTLPYRLKKHKCVGETSQLHQSPTEENREAEPLTSSSTQHMETEADGDECGGSEPGSNSDPLLQSDSDDKMSDFPEPDTEVTDVDCMYSQSGFTSVDNTDVPRSDRRHNTGKRSTICFECGKTFSCNSSLNLHKKIHSGEKPFSCSVCSKRFIKRGDLVVHVRSHTGVKPFTCSVCGKGFTQKGHMTRHTVIHTREKRYSCLVCAKRFPWSYELKKHKCVG